MKKRILFVSTLSLVIVLIIANLAFASGSVSTKPDKSGYYTITTSAKLKLTGNTKITLPISFSKNPVTSKTFTKSGKNVSATISITSSTLSITPKSKLSSNSKYTLKFTTKNKKKYLIILTSAVSPTPTPIVWQEVYDETFDTPFNEPADWTKDTYDKSSPYYVDAYSEKGDYFIEKGGQNFLNNLSKFDSLRKSYTYGKDGWLTVELYGRDSNKDGKPDSGGKFVTTADGKAELISAQHTDGAIIRSTNALPSKYKIEVTVSNINFGGENNGSWTTDGKFNGYDGAGGTEMAGPWDFSGSQAEPSSAVNQNGLYFLCITDYKNPAPHNNVFIHHHRKVVMDTDNNYYPESGYAWSNVWNPKKKEAVMDGSKYISMIWLNGESFGDDRTGNEFASYTPGGWMYDCTFTDKYIDNNSYIFSIERDGKSYTMSVQGTFYYGGKRTYKASKKFTDYPVTWHYNQTAAELKGVDYGETKTFNKHSFKTWPKDSAYPDYFFFGDPHINYYEGTAEFDDVKLYLPKQ